MAKAKNEQKPLLETRPALVDLFRDESLSVCVPLDEYAAVDACAIPKHIRHIMVELNDQALNNQEVCFLPSIFRPGLRNCRNVRDYRAEINNSWSGMDNQKRLIGRGLRALIRVNGYNSGGSQSINLSQPIVVNLSLLWAIADNADGTVFGDLAMLNGFPVDMEGAGKLISAIPVMLEANRTRKLNTPDNIRRIINVLMDQGLSKEKAKSNAIPANGMLAASPDEPGEIIAIHDIFKDFQVPLRDDSASESKIAREKNAAFNVFLEIHALISALIIWINETSEHNADIDWRPHQAQIKRVNELSCDLYRPVQSQIEEILDNLKKIAAPILPAFAIQAEIARNVIADLFAGLPKMS